MHQKGNLVAVPGRLLQPGLPRMGPEQPFSPVKLQLDDRRIEQLRRKSRAQVLHPDHGRVHFK